jgi:hypothetical protein
MTKPIRILGENVFLELGVLNPFLYPTALGIVAIGWDVRAFTECSSRWPSQQVYRKFIRTENGRPSSAG